MLDIRGLQNVSDGPKNQYGGLKLEKDIDLRVTKCIICSKYRPQQPEPLIPTPFPDRPWQKVGTDIFE